MSSDLIKCPGSILYVVGIQVVRVYTAMRPWWFGSGLDLYLLGSWWSGSGLDLYPPGSGLDLVLDLGLNYSGHSKIFLPYATAYGDVIPDTNFPQ